MQNLAELQLEAIMQHLRQCPSDKSPNKDYILGLIAGIEMAGIAFDTTSNELLNEEAVELMQSWEPNEEDTLEEEDFVRNT